MVKNKKSDISKISPILISIVVSFIILINLSSCNKSSETYRFNGIYIDDKNSSNIEFKDGENCEFYKNKITLKGKYKIEKATIIFTFNDNNAQKEYLAEIIDEEHLNFYSKDNANEKTVLIKQ